jgi:predicted nucleotidyltransferase
MNPKIETVVAEVRRHFKLLYGNRLVHMVLFGSQARGEAEPGSDIDILVVLKGLVFPCEEIERTLNYVAEVSLNYNVVVSCVFVSEQQFAHEQSPMLLNVRREGVPL